MIENTKKPKDGSRVLHALPHTTVFQPPAATVVSRTGKHALQWVTITRERAAMVRRVNVTLAVTRATGRCGEVLSKLKKYTYSDSGFR